MFEVSIIEVDNQKSNTILKRSINLDQNLDCFLMISSSNKNLAENLLNHSLESIIDKISCFAYMVEKAFSITGMQSI